MKQTLNLRWWIAGLLAAAIALNYLDRQNFPVAVVEIQKSIPLSDEQYADLQVLFLFAYAVMYSGGGKFLDLVGTRVGYAIMIVWWSIANCIHGFVNGIEGLGVARVLLGIGEAGGFPGAAKAVSEWFPPEERSSAFGIFTAGSSFGAVIAVPLISAVIATFGWRWVFFFTGALGLLCAIAWWCMYRPPEEHKWITPSEREYIRQTSSKASAVSGSTSDRRLRWLELFRYRQLWGLLAAKFLSDSTWFFLIFWLPKYLADIRRLNIREIGYYAWIPYAFSALGCLFGGWLSSYLMRGGMSLDHSRKIALGISASLLPVSMLITRSPLSIAIAFFSLALFGHQFWSTILQTLAADMFPSVSVGSVAGLMGTAGALGAMLFNYVVGMILTRQGYGTVFLIAGLLHPCSFAIILLIVRKIKPVVQLAGWRQSAPA